MRESRAYGCGMLAPVGWSSSARNQTIPAVARSFVATSPYDEPANVVPDQVSGETNDEQNAGSATD